ncbi:MAG: type VI secretion system-associated FHA domain protein TagH [Proteobacteria bacterium]|nr:type VI secretion system-associated FHA domain protein TagH [Pseudomonadota bacterium]
MALRLEVISSQRQALGALSSIVLGVSGGSIGRALDNDWALPDPRRYLSGHHARIHFRQGAFFLEDASTNGVYVNDATAPQGRRGLYALRDGDLLRMGEYRIRVGIDAEEGVLPPPSTGTLAQISVDNVVPLRAVGSATDDLGASLNIEALIPSEVSGPIAKLGAASLASSRQGGADVPLPQLSAQERLSRLRAAARARLEGRHTAMPDVHNALQAFCRSAGIDESRLPMQNEAQSMQLVGRMLREAVIGLKEILRAQQAFRDRYGIDVDPPEGRSPLEQGADEYMLDLLTGHEQGKLDAVMRLRGQFSHAGSHSAAVDPAVRSALAQFMAHLSPARMEAGSLPAKPNGADNWERYKDIYSNLLQATGEDVPHLFIEAISQAYQAARRRNGIS